MKISGSTKVDLNISNFDYNIGIFTNSESNNTINMGLSQIKENNKTKNCANLESNLGPLNIKLSLFKII